MIRKLRHKFILASMVSLVLVLSVIIGTINVVNYRGILDSADNTLQMILRNGGVFPSREEPPKIGFGGFGEEMSPEAPYQARFFMVILNPDGGVVSVNTDRIAAVDTQRAIEMATEVYKKKEPSGFVGSYRFACREDERGAQILFLDCNRELSTFWNFLFVSCAASLAGMLAVWVLLLLLSNRFVRPLSESYEKQKRFITDAGHEIKTPITIIEADAELLEMELADNEWLQDIRLQTRRLTDLTNELIFLSRMDEEQAKLQTIEFPLSDLICETAASFQSLALTQGKVFQADVEPMISINGEERSLRQLVSILLDNAVKYAPEGGWIDLNLHRAGKSVILQVRNTTAGVERGDLSHLFDRFYRGDKSRNSAAGGYGLGLSIASAIVQAHKGKITASSPDGIQMVLEVQLPVNLP